MKIYEIETKRISDGTVNGQNYHRFVSLFNGTFGIWRTSKDKAAEDGDKHQHIISSLHDTNYDKWNIK